MATIKKYNGSTWENAVVRKYGTASEIIVPPTTIYADGTAISTYTIKGNTEQNGTPTPSNPVAVVGLGELETTGEHTGEYKIPILTAQGTSNIYLSEPLYKIGDYADVINADGTITRNIGHIKLNTLTWSDYGTNQFASTQSIDKMFGSGADTMLCDSYICVVNRSTLVNNSIAPWNSSTSNRLVVQDNQYSTAADWIAAMGDVGIWFILATPTTEQITLPAIATTEGANSITVDTTVQPSEFTATWTGWHDSSVKEYDGTNWQ